MALCNLGVVMARRSRLDEAIEYWTRAVASDPELIDARMNLALGLTQLNRLPESLEHFRQATRIDPQLFRARLTLGENLLRLGRCDEAIEELSAALRLRPANASAESQIAAAYQRLGRSAEAAARYRNVLKRQPDYLPALMGLAVVCSTAKQSDVRNRAGGDPVGLQGLRVDGRGRPRVAGRSGNGLCRGRPLCGSRTHGTAKPERGGQDRQYAVRSGRWSRWSDPTRKRRERPGKLPLPRTRPDAIHFIGRAKSVTLHGATDSFLATSWIAATSMPTAAGLPGSLNAMRIVSGDLPPRRLLRRGWPP